MSNCTRRVRRQFKFFWIRNLGTDIDTLGSDRGYYGHESVIRYDAFFFKCRFPLCRRGVLTHVEFYDHPFEYVSIRINLVVIS
ncbi:hypothetical protein X956_02335 [Trueperella pyogenes TP8]|nr:hypothetical protein X956_02335 [Trueperella pyogenes TP8]